MRDAARSPAWRPVVAGVLLATMLACALAACGSGSPSAGASQQTEVVRVRPVSSGGIAAAGYRTTSTAADASCEPGSEAIGQAYRCFAGNTVYDPCWAEKAATATVLCLADPWSDAVARLTVSSGLAPIPNEGGIGEPWGLQLVTGQRCLLVQGAHQVFRGRVVDYYCGPTLSLLRGLTKSSRPWTAHSVLTKSGQLTSGSDLKIAIAWFGTAGQYR